ncbi:MAG: molybdopterin-dependent oxidoreductase [Armatimonadota bacterium]|nr:molybdopterin-dependent oxidoreductase [Armatimonadota bacterium]
MKLSRREFLIVGGSTALVATAASAPALRRLLLSPRRVWYQQATTQIPTVCEMCLWRCGAVAHVAGGRVWKLDGHPDNPKSNGRLCARGLGGIGELYDPDRLRRPLIRTGARGEGKFREATWDEALDVTAKALLRIKEQYGPEAVAFFGHYAGDKWFVDYLAPAWGSPNAARPSVSMCTAPREVAAMLTFGRPLGGHEPVDWEQTRYIVLLGTHIGENAHNTPMQEFAAARARGAQVVVVDPRFSTAASKADRYLPIKPGTDTALLLAWMHVLVTEGLYDRAYVERWTEGFDQLAAHVRAFTPQWAAAITELPAESIVEVARDLARYRPQAVVVPSRHVVWYGNDTQRLRALYLVNVLLGNWGRPGGFYIAEAPYIEEYPLPPFPIGSEAGGCAGPGGPAPEPTHGRRPRADGVRHRFLRGGVAIQELLKPMITGEPYPIKGLVTYAVNLFHSLPDPERTRRALAALDFHVVIDILPQDHVAWADVVLPECTYLERYDDLIAVAHKRPFIALRQPVVAPLYETKPGWWIARELGLRLGLAQYFPWTTIEEYLEQRLNSAGLTLEEMKKTGVSIQKGRPYLEEWKTRSPFPTPSGKIRLYCDDLAEAGLDPLPRYEPTADPPQGFFRLLYGRAPVHTFARTQNNPVLTRFMATNDVWVNRRAAAALGLRTGDRVMLVNQDGARSGPVTVRATARIRPDCVYIVHGFGHRAPGLRRAHTRGASDAALQTRYALDPVSGGAGLRVNFVRLERV